MYSNTIDHAVVVVKLVNRFAVIFKGLPETNQKETESSMTNIKAAIIFSLGTLMFLTQPAMAQTAEGTLQFENQEMFFNRLTSLCGARFEGRSVFPEDPGDAFRDQLLVAVVETCSEEEIRIPFLVGKDHSRTWVLKKTAHGLQLKHDHRHEDGTPDEVTLYGGTAINPGTHISQSFPADAYTAELIPEAATNEWFLSLSKDAGEMTYYLERHNEARFKAILKRVSDPGGEVGQN